MPIQDEEKDYQRFLEPLKNLTYGNTDNIFRCLILQEKKMDDGGIYSANVFLFGLDRVIIC